MNKNIFIHFEGFSEIESSNITNDIIDKGKVKDKLGYKERFQGFNWRKRVYPTKKAYVLHFDIKFFTHQYFKLMNKADCHLLICNLQSKINYKRTNYFFQSNVKKYFLGIYTKEKQISETLEKSYGKANISNIDYLKNICIDFINDKIDVINNAEKLPPLLMEKHKNIPKSLYKHFSNINYIEIIKNIETDLKK